MLVSITEVHNRLSYWLKRVTEQAVIITRRGEPVGVLVSPEEYERLRQVRAYLEMQRLSYSLQESDVTADGLSDASKREADGSLSRTQRCGQDTARSAI